MSFRPLPFVVIATALLPLMASAQTSVELGNLRIQSLAPDLVRIEQKGPHGFEDRTTFNVVQRTGWRGESWKIVRGKDGVILGTANASVLIPNPNTIVGVQVRDRNYDTVFEYKLLPGPSFLPSPGKLTGGYVIADSPRIIPAPWGATPTPATAKTDHPDTSGWDLTNDAPDVYVFLTKDYFTLRKELLRLTGPTEIPPKFMFGFIDSRWYPYTAQEALTSIEEYRKRQIPLDTFVIDTDWRSNGSYGYEPSHKYFPDFPEFFRQAHDLGVHVMANDHPNPAGPPLSPAEMDVRYAGLTSVLGMGLDVWWYDRNWDTSLPSPLSLPKEVWGQAVYHDTELRFRPNVRPVIMTNVQGIDNGSRDYAPSPASHRYPVQWTGDTATRWASLKTAVANSVDEGVIGLLPYVHDDLGGHIGIPTPELYTRYLEFGSLGPITRVHCTLGRDRHPWAYGAEAQQIVTDYIRLRYRLLPTIYSAAHQNFLDGTPLLRRLDLDFPNDPLAASSDEYLLGDDLLVAPMTSGADTGGADIPNDMLENGTGQHGLTGEYYTNKDLEGKPTVTRLDPNIAFNWDDEPPDSRIPQTNFSVRWTGTIGPVPKSGTYIFHTVSDDGVRVFVDGHKLIDEWHPSDSEEHSGRCDLQEGAKYKIEVRYFQAGGGANCKLTWALPGQVAPSGRDVWVPPGDWIDFWTGEPQHGPKTVRVETPLWKTPLLLRAGGVVFLGPDVQATGTAPFDGLRAFVTIPSTDTHLSRTLYEDDGGSNDYKKGAGATTQIDVFRSHGEVTVEVGAQKGAYRGMPLKRSGLVEFIWPAGETPKATLDGKAVACQGANPLFPDTHYTPGPPTWSISLPEARSRSHTIRILAGHDR